MARGRRGIGARNNRNRKSGTGSTGSTGSSGGGSKGGSRGSGGRNNPGSNKNARGKTNTSTSTKSGGPSKGPSGGGTKRGGKHQSGSPSKTAAPTKKKTARERAQEAAKKRREAGISVSDAVSMNKQSMKDKAKERHAKFKKDGFQTKGGRFAKDSEGRVYDARKKAVQDAAKKRHQKFVQDRKDRAVDKKSAQLAAATGIPSGANLKAGSFGISAAGREQAAANIQAARQAMNLKSGLNIGSEKFKDGQKIAGRVGYPHSNIKIYDGVDYYGNPYKYSGVDQGAGRLNDDKIRFKNPIPRADAGEVFGTLASLNPAAQLGNLVLGGPASAAQFKSDTGDEGAAGTPESGGLSIAKKVVESINPMARALSIAPSAFDALTLNTFDFDGLGGQTQFGKDLNRTLDAYGDLTGNKNQSALQQVTGALKFGRDNLSDIVKFARQDDASMGEVADAMEYARDIKNLGPLKATANLTPTEAQGIGDVYNFAKDTDLYNNTLTKFGGEGFPSAVNQFADYVGENYNKLSDDVAANRRVVSDMMIGNDPRLDVPKAIAYQYQDQVNPNLRDLGIAGFQTAVQNAMLPNAQKLKGINKDERGIVGSIGNFLLSNDAKNIATQNLPGTTNALSLASNIIASGSDPTSSTYKDSQRFLRTAGVGGPTPESILKGITGFGSGGSNKPLSGASKTQPVPTLVPEEILEFLEPTVPTTDTSEMSLPEFVDPTDAYNDALNEFLYNPNYFPEVQQYQKKPVKTFAQTFNRDYF